MGKKVVANIRLHIAAGAASPGPPVGPALGQHGLNIMQFVKAFNAQTASLQGLTVPVDIQVYGDRSFKFDVKTPVTSDLIKRAIGIQKGSSTPNRDKVGKITLEQAKEIAKMKMPDLYAASEDAAVKTVLGTARAMGVDLAK
jgi:large subunit ribosomal protein L11